MAYNKSKFVDAAQKLLNQGKVAQAIAEYQQILKHEPRDQVTLMTIGELYIRQGETFQAIDYFERLAQLFVGDGFLTKAIAVYKRIAKLAPEEIRPLEKLADLYVQQGVMSEARPLFLQLAEIHLKNNRQPEAVALLKKLLMAEPDNLRIQIRLADLYQAMGQAREALEAYVSAAQRALARGDHGECEKLADKALKLDPHNVAAVIVKARSYSTQGNFTQAAQLLEQLPDLEKGGEHAELLLDLYLKNVKWDQATDLALRTFEADPKNFGLAQKTVETLLEAGQSDRAVAILDKTRIPMIDAGEHEVVGKLLNDLAARMPGRIEPLEWLVDTYGRTSDSFRLPDALAQLGDALVAADKLERAKAVFEQLVDRQPESDPAKRKLNDVLRRMGTLATAEPPGIVEEHAPVELVKPPAPKVRPDLEPPPPEVHANPAVPAVPVAAAPVVPVAVPEPPLDEDTQRFIAQSLTDVDLFASYGLTQKAIGLLEAVLRRAPRHTPTLEKLLDFVLGAGDDRRTAELAAQLEQIHTQRGDARGAERFGELRRRFQRAAGLSDEDLALHAAPPSQHVAEAAIEEVLPEIEAEATPGEPAVEEVPADVAEVSASPAASTEAVHEVDLSDEWATMLEQSQQAEPSVPVSTADSAPEFQIPVEASEPEHFDAATTFEQPASAPVSQTPPEFSIPTEAPEATELPEHAFASSEPAAKPAEETHEEVYELPDFEESVAPAASEEAPAHAAVPEAPAAQAPHPSAPVVPEAPQAPEPEFELDQDYELVLDPESLVPAYDQKPPEAPNVAHEPETVGQNGASAPAPSAFASDQFLSELAAEIDHLDIGGLAPEFSQPLPSGVEDRNAAKSQEKPPSPVESGPLKEVFEEFRAELGEMGSEDEDLETHYNLGIAFREMGLLEEAISEFQKVAKAIDHGRTFRYSMQCCTLLGLAFMEKGQPAIAAMWYERALRIPSIEPESELALRYDLGVAQESAGELDAAQKSFLQVYAVNIDYRDVGERIAALQKLAH
jgi:pilus assembly protein FimV